MSQTPGFWDMGQASVFPYACGLGRLVLAAARNARRARDVALFVDEIQILVISINGVVDQHLSLALAGFRLLTDVAVFVQEVQVFRVVALESEFLNLLCHGLLGFVKLPARCL